jgi:co-chaperonin GroES (HSP10)
MELIGNQILFKPLPANEVSNAGLFIPETAREISNKGIIVKTGAGTKKNPMRLEDGMIGYRVKNWGEPVEIHGELHYMMDEKAIIALA